MYNQYGMPPPHTPYNNNIITRTAVNSVPYNQTNTITPRVNKAYYAQKTTKNKSFLDMYHYLQSIGVKNCTFMLALVDPDLEGIDPHDPHLTMYYKQKVLRECLVNYWYFIREVVRLPSRGGVPMMYVLHRGNLAFNFCVALNFNIFFELPRQKYKTTSAIVRYLYVYNFGTTNSKIAFLHKDMKGSNDNLQTLKDIRDLLPPYLIMKERLMPDGKVDKGKNNTTEIINPFNRNNIKTYASATNRARAASLLRGKSLPIIWYDEYAFLPFNDTIYMNAAPAFKTAAKNAKDNNAPYGILITTTPGFMSTEEGKEAYMFKELATPFSESWYDLPFTRLKEILDANTKSNFVYIKFSYQELGESEEWFNEMCKDLKYSGPDIRREILLEWSSGVESSPFKSEDLDAIGNLIKEPINVCYLLNKYRFETYFQTDTRTYPPIIGVDVSGDTLRQDSSTITIIDSRTTKVLGCLNCNYISSLDLARCIEFIVKNWMPNAIVNVERNGGYGSSVIGMLIKMGLKKNLYYEIKDQVVEERQDGVHSYKHKVRTKVYGLTSTKNIRKLLIELLLDRVENHKDKFMSPIIYNELLGMEIKKNGKVEHSASTHDDQIFSMLMALYVWYEGTDLAERYGIRKTAIKTDDNVDEQLDVYNDNSVEIVSEFNTKSELDEEIEKDLQSAIAAGGVPLDKFLEEQRAKERAQYEALLRTPMGENAYRQKYHIPPDVPLSNYLGFGTTEAVPDAVFTGFYNPADSVFKDYSNSISTGAVPESQAHLLEDEDYKYSDYFNF